jgi:hypothetical protein
MREDGELSVAVVVLLVLLAVVLIYHINFRGSCVGVAEMMTGGRGESRSESRRGELIESLLSESRAYNAPDSAPDSAPDNADSACRAGAAKENKSVDEAFQRMYSAAEVDPIVTGNLYNQTDRMRNVYAQRTSHGDVWGLTEYSSSGSRGDVGVDVGPFGLNEYGCKKKGYDDGIPESWAMSSTPVRWYGPSQRDYYGIEGPTVYSEGLYALTEPDHDPLMP